MWSVIKLDTTVPNSPLKSLSDVRTGFLKILALLFLLDRVNHYHEYPSIDTVKIRVDSRVLLKFAPNPEKFHDKNKLYLKIIFNWVLSCPEIIIIKHCGQAILLRSLQCAQVQKIFYCLGTDRNFVYMDLILRRMEGDFMTDFVRRYQADQCKS